MSDEKPPQLVDYFVVAGLAEASRALEEEQQPRPARPGEPITDVAVIIRSQGEEVPQGFTCIETSTSGHPVDLNAGLLNNPQMFLCYKRGRDKPPLIELGVHYEGKDRPKPGYQILDTTPYSRSANLASGSPGHQRTFLTFRRAAEPPGHHTLGVTDICLVMPSKGESTPHTFCRVDKNLNTSMWGPALFLCYKIAVAKDNTLVYEAGVWRRYPVPRGVPAGAAVGGTGAAPGAAQRGGPAASARALPAHPQEHLRPVPLALLRRLPQVPHVHLPLLHLGPPRAAPGDAHLPLHAQRALPVPAAPADPGPDVPVRQPAAVPARVLPAAPQRGQFPDAAAEPGPRQCGGTAGGRPHRAEAAHPLPAPRRPDQRGRSPGGSIHSSYFDLYEPPRDVIFIDLDTNTIFQSEERKLLSPRALPRRPCKVLLASLHSLSQQLDELLSAPGEEEPPELVLSDAEAAGARRAQLELEARAAFLRFMACALRGYRSFLRPIAPAPAPAGRDAGSLFALQGFLRSRERAYQRFYGQLLRTQLFTQFIEDCSFASDREPCLEFFDTCVDKVQVDLEKPEDTPLMELDDPRGGEHTVFITPPEQPAGPDGAEPPARYRYDGFPTLRPELLEPPRDPLVAQLCQARSSAPSSPAPRRTKQEMKVAQRVAQKSSAVPELWARCLLGHCYGLWFLYLPTHVRAAPAKLHALQLAYDVLRKMEQHKVVLPDEVCYRILMQLCGQYGEPVLSVRVLLEMKRAGIVPNTVTYGYYNKAVLESKWPAGTQGGRLRWAKLRNVVLGAAQFRQPLRQRERRSAGGDPPDDRVPPAPRPPLQRQTTWAGRSLRDPAPAPRLVKSGSLSFPGTARGEGAARERPGEPPLLPATPTPPPPRPRGPPGSADGSLSDIATDDSGGDEGPAGGPGGGPGGATPRRGLAAKLQQLLSPGKRPPSRPAEPPREPGARRGSEQRDGDPSSRRSPAESLLRPRERPESTASESSVSLGSELDLSDASGGSTGAPKSTEPCMDGAAGTEPPALEVLLSSCSRCPGCAGLVFDEELMAGWTSDDSNLNTSCPFCSRSFVPFLSIEIRDFRRPPSPPGAGPVPPSPQGPVLSDRRRCLELDETPELCNGCADTPPPGRRERVAFAYLSPLVLRKELESLMENEGGELLARPELVDSHPIIFWNLVWYFQRLALPSNLPLLLLGSQHAPRDPQPSEPSCVRVRLLWDVLSPDPESCPPLYVLWRLHSNVPPRLHPWGPPAPPFSLTFLEALLSHVGLNEVHKAIGLFLETLAAPGAPRTLHRSIYRELLFLTLAALGREHTDIAAFDRRYRSALGKLGGALGRDELRRRRAQPPSAKASDCRRTFGAPPEC
ncbi:DENN domain-containing protein 4B isoform X2 [Vidua chalybeata]|uniref:DENN domain-containing protein 4B isoform X2 n=1 Tax=Vidua chalybeata TaxID=81927 RepID=UPI0023A880E0|nr:DENN domain-containing protein 4B isoform X2 [Vidua chalybeata]